MSAKHLVVPPRLVEACLRLDQHIITSYALREFSAAQKEIKLLLLCRGAGAVSGNFSDVCRKEI